MGDGSTPRKRLLCLALPLRRPAGAQPKGTAAGGASQASEGCCSGPGVQTAGGDGARTFGLGRELPAPLTRGRSVRGLPCPRAVHPGAAPRRPQPPSEENVRKLGPFRLFYKLGLIGK